MYWKYRLLRGRLAEELNAIIFGNIKQYSLDLSDQIQGLWVLSQWTTDWGFITYITEICKNSRIYAKGICERDKFLARDSIAYA